MSEQMPSDTARYTSPRPIRMIPLGTRNGAGRVVSVMTDSVWHWRMGAKSWSADRSPYDVFWSQLMEWLIPKEQDKQGVAKLELVTERPA